MKINEDRSILRSKYRQQYQEMFSMAGKLAIHELKAAGLPVTYVKNDRIIKEYADGHTEDLGAVPPRVTRPKRVIVINQ